VVKHHRENADGLPKRLLPQPRAVQVGNERGDHLGVEPVDGLIAKLGKDPSQRNAVRRERAGGDVDARRLPASCNFPESLGRGAFGETEIRHAQRCELTRQPRLSRERVAFPPERSAVARQALATAKPVHHPVALATSRRAGRYPDARHRASS
jgi:hypothetical protein